MKLKFVDDLSGGRKRFRRRWPKAVAEVLGESFFQVSMKARDGAALFTEHAALLSKFDSMIAKVMQDAEQLAKLSARQRWEQVVSEAARLVEGVKGLDEDEVRQIVADDIAQRHDDPTAWTSMGSEEALTAWRSPDFPQALIDAGLEPILDGGEVSINIPGKGVVRWSDAVRQGLVGVSRR